MKITQSSAVLPFYRYLFIIGLFFLSTAFKKEDTGIRAAYGLIERVTPGYSKQFVLELIPAGKDGQDVYEIDGKKGKVILRGNNPVSLATAYNQYLKYTCGAHVSWFGDQLKLPKSLPAPVASQKGKQQVINGKYRVYMNYCTFSYTAPWWDWKRWERELDYMAMNSINMPLAAVGLEAVWYNTLLKYGFTDEEARGCLTGPAHFAWQWMQNIQSYGGPLPLSWIESHIELGRQIINRQLELGMQPIQQGFSGYVPREMRKKFPKAKISKRGGWCGFQGAAQLDPTDPLFLSFGRDFLEEEKKLFGAHGVYAADPFHEGKPPVDTPEYLDAVGKAIHQLFKSFDPNALWAMQSWSLREPIVKAVPKSDLLILDLSGGRCDKTHKEERNNKNAPVWGYPVVAGNLHNFGGRINMHGDLGLIASNQYATARDKWDNVCGSGLFMESIIQNPVFYELTFEMPLHAGKVNLEEWLADYAARRYGAPSKKTAQAWLYLLEGPYKKGTNGTERSSIIAARPALNVKKSGPNKGLGIPYSPLLLWKAQRLLLDEADKLGASKPYRFDLVDLQRQILTNLGQVMHKRAAGAFKKKDRKNFLLHSKRFLELMHDTDVLLRTREEFNFDKWLTDARSWGTTEAEKNLLEKDATALVTIWGGDGDPRIFDYSWREWAGLIENFYLKRWQMFYDEMLGYLDRGEEYTEEGLKLAYGREDFRANALYNKMADWEMNFVSTYNKARTPITQGDEIEIAKRLFKKYFEISKEYYSKEMAADKIVDGKSFENLGED
ncbi:alpha-N-acetylglucosaminidase [Bacteroides congonensis]